jgi:hypothetical protein
MVPKGSERSWVEHEEGYVMAQGPTLAQRRWRWEVVKPPPYSLKELETGIAAIDFRLNRERDYPCLGLLLDHNFLTARQLTMLGLWRSLNHTQHRLHDLFAVGLVARRAIVRRSKRRRAWEYAYGLTAFGVEGLRWTEWPGTETLAADWLPPFERESVRNNAEHEVAVADLCLGIMEYLGARYHIEWFGSREAVEVVSAGEGGGPRRMVSPDAALYITAPNGTRVLLLIEYERTAHPEKVTRRLQQYASYFTSQPWRRKYGGLTAQPFVVWSVSATADQRRYWADPYAHVKEMGGAYPILYPRVWLLSESGWRSGLYTLESVEPGHKTLGLHQLVDGAALRV